MRREAVRRTKDAKRPLYIGICVRGKMNEKKNHDCRGDGKRGKYDGFRKKRNPHRTSTILYRPLLRRHNQKSRVPCAYGFLFIFSRK